MYIAASSRCFSDQSFDDACRQIVELEFDRVEIWLNEESGHLKPSEVVGNIEGFQTRFRDYNRLTPVAFTVEHDITAETMRGLCEVCRQMKVTQINVPASPLGTPFNSEIDRLKEFVAIGNTDGVRIAIQTRIGHLTEDPHTAVELCQSVRGLGLALDPSCYICGPYRNQTFDQVFPYAFHVNLRDTSPTNLQVQVGLGEVDYARIIQMLKRDDFARSLSVDFFPELFGQEISRPLEMRKLRLLLETHL